MEFSSQHVVLGLPALPVAAVLSLTWRRGSYDFVRATDNRPLRSTGATGDIDGNADTFASVAPVLKPTTRSAGADLSEPSVLAFATTVGANAIPKAGIAGFGASVTGSCDVALQAQQPCPPSALAYPPYASVQVRDDQATVPEDRRSADRGGREIDWRAAAEPGRCHGAEESNRC